MNGFFEHTNTVADHTLARGSQINAIADSVEAGFEKLPAEAEIKAAISTAGADTGAVNAYAVAMPYAPTAYAADMLVSFTPAITNTLASTIDVDELGAVAIKRYDGTDVVLGDLVAGRNADLRHNGTVFIMQVATDISVTATAAALDAIATAADAVSTAADVVLTNADVVLTNAAVVTTNADAATTTQDAIDTAADAVTTAQDAIDTAANAVTTAQDAIDTAADAASTATDAATATTQATSASASATAAAIAAAANLYSSISNKTDADSPIAPVFADNGTLIVCDTSAGAVVVNLPSIAIVGEGFRIAIQKSSGSNTITINRDGTDTINGAANFVMYVDTEFVTLVADDATTDNWVSTSITTTQAGDGLAKSGATISLDLAGANTWTGVQKAGIKSDDSGAFNMTSGNDFTRVCAASGTLTFSNYTLGQRGMIHFDNSAGYTFTTEAAWKTDPDFDSTISVAGVYVLAYWCYDGVSVVVMNSQAVS